MILAHSTKRATRRLEVAPAAAVVAAPTEPAERPHPHPRRLALINDQPYVGGLVWHLGYLAHWLQEQGWEARFYFDGDRGCGGNTLLPWLSAQGITWRMHEGRGAYDDWLAGELRKFGPGTVLLGWKMPEPVAAIAGPWHKLLLFGGSAADRLVTPELAACLDGILGVSEAMRACVPERGRHLYQTVFAGLPTGDLERCREERERHRAALGIPADATVVLWAGRLVSHGKRPDLLRALIERHPELHWLVCGAYSASAAGTRREWDALARSRTNLTLQWKLQPHEMHAAFGAADLYLHTSDAEGLSTSTMEAMAAGLPVLTTDCHGQRELIRDGEGGWIVPCGDLVALDRRLSEILAMPAAAREGAARRGQAETLARCSLPVYGRRFAAALEGRRSLQRVAFVVGAPYIGGLHWRLVQIASELRRQGVESLFLFREGLRPDLALYGEMDERRIAYTTCPDGADAEEWMERRLREFAPDAVCLGWMDEVPAFLCCSEWKLTTFLAGPDSLTLIEQCHGETQIIGTSDDMLPLVPPERLPHYQTIPSGIETGRFGGVARDEARRRLGLPQDVPLVLWVGRAHHAQKRADVLHEVARRVRRRVRGALVLAVSAWPPTEKPPGCVIYRALRPSEMPDAYAAADCYLSTSDYEGLSIATLEAMASGLPVVSTDAHGQRGLIEGAGCGWVAPCGDAVALADLVVRALRLPGGEWAEMGQRGQAYVRANHDVGPYVRRLVDAWERRALGRPLKVAMVDRCFGVGGAEWMAALLWQHRPADLEIRLFTHGEESPLLRWAREQGMPAETAVVGTPVARWQESDLPAAIETWGADVVYAISSAHSYPTIRRWPVVVHGGGKVLCLLGTPDEVASVAKVICVSPGVLEANPQVAPRAVVLPNGIDAGAWARAYDGAAHPGRERTILWVGRMAQVKDIPLLEAVIAETASRGLWCRWLVAGYAQEISDSELRQWEQTVETYGVEWVQDVLPHQMPAVYARAGVYLSTSRSEGMSLTALQAMACGMPIVTTLCGIEEITGGGCASEPLALVDALAGALALSHEERARVREEGRAKARGYNIGQWAARMGEILREAERIARSLAQERLCPPEPWPSYGNQTGAEADEEIARRARQTRW